ncbi:MAG TPA: LysE family translocator [Gaiellaceae bacterium]|nr:LysE family translocator [Gaiellaceae bacterium]
MLEFLAIAVLVIVTPGPDTALTIRNTLLGGRRTGISTALGVATGQAVWAFATALGVAALLAASEPAFFALRIAGAAYLVYLGAVSLLAAIRQSAREPVRRRIDRSFRQGLLSNLGNPKMAAFFPSLLPQFATSDATFASLLALGLLFSAMTLAWLTAYAFAVARAGDLLRRSAVKRALDAVAGAVLVALGLRVAASARS